MKITDLKEGDSVPAGTMVEECYMLVYPDGYGPPVRLRMPALPIDAYTYSPQSAKDCES